LENCRERSLSVEIQQAAEQAPLHYLWID
jgi:hypothetical protein